MQSAFRGNQIFHLRPGCFSTIENSEMPVTDPHRDPPRSWPLSTVKIIYWLIDYIVGYWWKVWPARFRTSLITFDRYYHDLLIDPLRYRYGGSMWLAAWIGNLVPKPDLWLLLDAPADVLQARKQEVPLEESARQRIKYRNFVNEFENSVVINANQPLDQVIVDVNAAILNFMARRTRQRLE